MSKFIFLKSLQTILTPLKRLIDQKAENVSWNENDPSSKGYIAGRTHYKEEKNVNYIQNEQVSFTNRDGMYVADVTRLNASVGDTLTVVWDGVEYECKVTSLNGACILGNGSILFGNEVENTGEPFLWGYNYEFSQIYTLDTSESHTVSCYGKISVVHKIPKEYLPDMIGKNGKGENAEIFNDYTNNIANGDYAHAEGSMTHAVSYAHAEGYKTEALSQYSHTEGYYTSAQQYASHAEGEWTYANGRVSHAEGSNTRANSSYQHVQGKYNVEDWSGKYAHIVGNGSYSERKNAHTIDWNGVGWFADSVKVGGVGQDDETAETLATETYVIEQINTAVQSSLPKTTTVTMFVADWDGDAELWHQTVTVSGITANSKLDLQPTAIQIVNLRNSEITLMLQNDNGVATAWAIGNKPTEDYEMQVLISEVIHV